MERIVPLMTLVTPLRGPGATRSGEHMARKGKVLNRLGRPKLLRKEIPTGEAAVGVLLLFLIVGMTLWLLDQRSNYDPGERDIDIALLVEQSVEDDLYRQPLKRWRDPSLGEVGGAPVNIGPFDPSLLMGGWQTASTPQTFVPDTLYEKINGQASQYMKFGFVELKVIELEHPGEGRLVDVYLYEQGTFEGSMGVYEEQRGGKEVLEFEGVRYTPNALGAIGMKGSLFFQATGDKISASIDAMTQKVIEGLAELDSAASTPPGFEMLNQGLGVPFEAIAYQPVNVFQYRFAQRFWFGELEGTDGERMFVHTAESPAAAKELFDKLHAELLEDYDGIESAPNHALLQHKYLETYFGLMHEGAMVFGVERHPEREGATSAMRRLQAALEGDGEQDGEEGYDGEGEVREY